MRLYRHEMKMNLKSLMIWTVCVGGICMGCILLYSSLEDSLQEIADAYANMGAMSVAFGMDKMSLATLTGFYATEVALMHGLGGAMFAAIVGGGMLSKEEALHTAEFLNTLPVSRKNIVIQKYAAFLSNILVFNVICVVCYVIGFVVMGEDISVREMILYHASLLLMQLEIGTICFLLSSFSKKLQVGTGLGITLVFFAMDVMCRIIPAIENAKYITPFYYCNAPDIFTSGKVDEKFLLIGAIVTVMAFFFSAFNYCRKDIAS